MTITTFPLIDTADEAQLDRIADAVGSAAEAGRLAAAAERMPAIRFLY